MSIEELDGTERMLTRFHAARPIIVLPEIPISGVSGLGVCERIRGNPDWSGVHIATFSANALQA
jgi:CheY-like chemotaxis protein